MDCPYINENNHSIFCTRTALLKCGGRNRERKLRLVDIPRFRGYSKVHPHVCETFGNTEGRIFLLYIVVLMTHDIIILNLFLVSFCSVLCY